MANVSFTFRIDEDDKKKVEELAKADQRSISFIVNQAIKEYLENHLKKEDYI